MLIHGCRSVVRGATAGTAQMISSSVQLCSSHADPPMLTKEVGCAASVCASDCAHAPPAASILWHTLPLPRNPPAPSGCGGSPRKSKPLPPIVRTVPPPAEPTLGVNEVMPISLVNVRLPIASPTPRTCTRMSTLPGAARVVLQSTCVLEAPYAVYVVS